MPRILTTCPTTGALVPTGHRFPELDPAALTAPRAFRCQACQQVHSWSADDAQVETGPTPPSLRPAA